MPDPVSSIGNAVAEIAKLLKLWIGSSDHRRMTKAVRYGDRICKRIRELNIEDDKLRKLMDKFDKYDN